MMEFRQLHHFITVVETGSISAAARHLNMAQPAISSSIKKLESDINVPLFHRRERGVGLTKAGQQFLQHARQILQQAKDAKLAIQAIDGLQQGEVQIGLPSVLGLYFFPPILMAFKHQYPGLSQNIIDTGTRNIRQKLLDGDIELGVIADKDLLPELASHKLIQVEMVVCMAPEHPLADLEKIESKDFLAHELVLFGNSYYHHGFIQKISRQEKTIPKVSFTTNLLPLIKSVIRKGYAISPMWRLAIQEDDQIVTRPFAEPFIIDLSLAWRRDSYLSRANQVFCDFVLQQVRNNEAH
ncbi:LysR family transcriptional regulator [Psychromonas sp. MME2]|uniref:LysR family transcriptional regulator n=1 Tax=Psychromonas sp. MME2 TaxID=3231033 RepID=UPI00339C3960